MALLNLWSESKAQNTYSPLVNLYKYKSPFLGVSPSERKEIKKEFEYKWRESSKDKAIFDLSQFHAIYDLWLSNSGGEGTNRLYLFSEDGNLSSSTTWGEIVKIKTLPGGKEVYYALYDLFYISGSGEYCTRKHLNGTYFSQSDYKLINPVGSFQNLITTLEYKGSDTQVSEMIKAAIKAKSQDTYLVIKGELYDKVKANIIKMRQDPHTQRYEQTQTSGTDEDKTNNRLRINLNGYSFEDSIEIAIPEFHRKSKGTIGGSFENGADFTFKLNNKDYGVECKNYESFSSYKKFANNLHDEYSDYAICLLREEAAYIVLKKISKGNWRLFSEYMKNPSTVKSEADYYFEKLLNKLPEPSAVPSFKVEQSGTENNPQFNIYME